MRPILIEHFVAEVGSFKMFSNGRSDKDFFNLNCVSSTYLIEHFLISITIRSRKFGSGIDSNRKRERVYVQMCVRERANKR